MVRIPTMCMCTDRDNVIILMRGELDLSVQDSFREMLHEALHLDRPARFVLDLEDVSFMDCAALGVLAEARHEVIEHGGSLVLTGASAPLKRMLAVTGVDQLMPVYENLAEALDDPLLADAV